MSSDRYLLPLPYITLAVERTSRRNARCGLRNRGARPKGSDYLVRERPLEEPAVARNRSLQIHLAVFKGIASLRSILAFLGKSLKADYTSLCGMGFKILSDPRKVEKLTRLFAKFETQALGDAWNTVHAIGDAESTGVAA